MNDKEPEVEGIPKPRKKRLKRFVIGLAVLAALLGGAAYFAQDWLIDEMRSLVMTTLSEAGIHVDYSSARQDPVRGAVLEEVFLYETEKMEKPVLTITNLGLSPSLKQWFLEGELSIRVTLKDSEISMLVGGQEVGRLEKVTSVMKAGASGVTIGYLSALMNGVDYQVKGRVDFGSGKDKGKDIKEIETVIEDEKKLLLDFSFLKPLGEWLSVETQEGKLHVISDFKIDVANLDGMIVSSQFSGKSFGWHGVAFDHIDAKVTYSGKDKSVTVKSIDTAYRGKPLAGELRFLMPDKTLEITTLDSQVDFLRLMEDYSGKRAGEGAPRVVLIQAPHLGVNGRVDFGGLEKSDLKIEFLNSAGAVVEAAGRQIKMEELKGKLALAAGNLSTLESGLSAKIAQGEVFVSGKMEVVSDEKAYQASLKLEGISINEMAALINVGGENKGLPGRLFFEFNGSGDKTTPIKDARGRVKIEGAKFYEMRYFGSLFAALNTAVPAFGKRKTGEGADTQELTGTYQVQDEVIRSDDLVFGGDLSQIVVKGDYNLQENTVNLEGKAELKGLVGLATDLVSNLLELSGVGPLNDIKWELKNLNAVGVIKVGTKGVTGTSIEILKLGGGTAKGAVKITGKSVEGISKGLKKVLPFKKKK